MASNTPTSGCSTYLCFLRGLCWPSLDDVEEASSTEELFEPVLAPIFDPVDYPFSEEGPLRSIREKGYGLMMALFRKAEQSQQRLSQAQWQRFNQELSLLESGQLSLMQVHQSPNDIHFHGDSYGSLPEQLMEILSLINDNDSPFYLELPSLAQATASVPPHIMERLNNYPTLRARLQQEHHQSNLQRMLEPTVSKSGAKNNLTVMSVNRLIDRLHRYLPRAKLLDEVSYDGGGRFDRSDRMLFQVHYLLVSLTHIKNELLLLQKNTSQENIQALSAGIRA